MSQRVRATVNNRLVVTSNDNETDETAQSLRDNAALLELITTNDVRDNLADVVDIQSSIVNVDEVAA
jgi:hypothetical protein